MCACASLSECVCASVCVFVCVYLCVYMQWVHVMCLCTYYITGGGWSGCVHLQGAKRPRNELHEHFTPWLLITPFKTVIDLD